MRLFTRKNKKASSEGNSRCSYETVNLLQPIYSYMKFIHLDFLFLFFLLSVHSCTCLGGSVASVKIYKDVDK